MLKSSLLEILRTFSKQELIKFEDFVRSPYFNKKENIVKVFLEIKKYAPEFSDEKLKKEMVWQKIFPGTEYNYGILKNLIFDLNKLAEQFIISLKSYKDEYKESEYLFEALIERKLHKIFLNKYNAIDKKPDLNYLNANNLELPDYLYFVSAIFKTKLSYHVNYDKNFKTEDLNQSLDLYKLSYFLLFIFDTYRIDAVNNSKQNPDQDISTVSKVIELILPDIDVLLESINKNSRLNALYIKIYLLLYYALKEKSENRYLDFKKTVFDNLNILPKNTIQDLHLGMLTVFRGIKHEKLNLYEVVDIYDSLIKNNLITLLDTNIIPIHIFNNYASACFYLSDLSKLETFVSRFINKLEPKHVENSRIYINSMISFLKKDFQESLKFVSLLDISYSTHKSNLKYQKAMCIYEIGDFEMFLNEFDNVKHFVKNNSSMTDSEKSKHISIYSIVKKLFNSKLNFDKYEFIQLKSDIKKLFEQSIFMNMWFGNKLAEIEKENNTG